jgi:hypothetical protein
MRRFLAVLRGFFHSSLLYTFSYHPSPPTILPSSLTSSCHLFLGLPLYLVVSKFIYNTILAILFSSSVCTCPHQRNLCNLIVSVMAGFYTVAQINVSFVFWKWRCDMHIVELSRNKKLERYEWGMSIQKNNTLYKLNTCKSFWKIQAVTKQCLIFFYFMLYTSWTCEHFTDLHYDVGCTVIFQPGLHTCQQTSSTCEAHTCSCLVKLALSPLWQMGAWHSSVPLTVIMVFKGPNRW